MNHPFAESILAFRRVGYEELCKNLSEYEEYLEGLENKQANVTKGLAKKEAQTKILKYLVRSMEEELESKDTKVCFCVSSLLSFGEMNFFRESADFCVLDFEP